jgi:hypothetical protein
MGEQKKSFSASFEFELDQPTLEMPQLHAETLKTPTIN